MIRTRCFQPFGRTLLLGALLVPTSVSAARSGPEEDNAGTGVATALFVVHGKSEIPKAPSGGPGQRCVGISDVVPARPHDLGADSVRRPGTGGRDAISGDDAPGSVSTRLHNLFDFASVAVADARASNAEDAVTPGLEDVLRLYDPAAAVRDAAGYPWRRGDLCNQSHVRIAGYLWNDRK